MRGLVWLAFAGMIASSGLRAAGQDTVPVGVAAADVTPGEALRLTGYGNRNVPSEGTEQPLRAKALAIGDETTGGAAVIVTVDNLGIPRRMTEEVARRLQAKAGLPRERFVVCASHTHTGPALSGVAPIIFGGPLPDEQQAAIDRYTKRLTDEIEAVALKALEDRKPGTLAWGQGSVGFAMNRRMIKDGKWTGFGVNPDGPVDHALPLVRVTDPEGKVRAVLVNYACHCTTLGPETNRYCGDWAGYAQEAIERDHPGAVALIAIGCGADANPEPRTGVPFAKDHGEAMGKEVKRLLASDLKPLGGVTEARLEWIELPFGTLPTREQLVERAKLPGAEGYHARVQLQRIEGGEGLPAELPYPVQAWAFGDDLAMVFLAGEVVVDYVLRLKRELDGSRLWVTAYANDAPCYIASRRILAEGGYEADHSMLFYDRPTRFAPEVEDRIVGAVEKLVPERFRAAGARP